MSEDRTPVEVAAEAVAAARHEAKKQGLDTWPLADVARAAFGSVDVDELAVEIGRHDRYVEPFDGAYCHCGTALRDTTHPQWVETTNAEIQRMQDRHVAEAVKAWLTNGEGA